MDRNDKCCYTRRIRGSIGSTRGNQIVGIEESCIPCAIGRYDSSPGAMNFNPGPNSEKVDRFPKRFVAPTALTAEALAGNRIEGLPLFPAEAKCTIPLSRL